MIVLGHMSFVQYVPPKSFLEIMKYVESTTTSCRSDGFLKKCRHLLKLTIAVKYSSCRIFGINEILQLKGEKSFRMLFWTVLF